VDVYGYAIVKFKIEIDHIFHTRLQVGVAAGTDPHRFFLQPAQGDGDIMGRQIPQRIHITSRDTKVQPL
jgi:hypothetical protein